jgi:pimeloyl-ACP methyl ester carboxylesterase
MRAWLLIALLGLTACGSDLETFHVLRGGVALPVVVRGPKDADTLIVFQHGGPGQADLDGVMAFERNLQRRFLYASWAQRTSGYSTGEVTRENSTLEDHYADMKAVLRVLRARYSSKRMIALGYSFGGIVTLGHLGSAEAEPVDGIVLIDTLFNGSLVEREDFRLLDAFAEQEIEADAHAARWRRFREQAARQEDAFAELSPHRYFERYTMERIDRCLAMERELGLRDDAKPVSQAGEIDVSAPLVIPGLVVPLRVIDWLAPELLHFDLTERAGSIRAPTLLLWGEHDCMVAPSVGEALFNALGTDAKELRMVEQAGHSLPLQRPEVVSRAIEEFIEGIAQEP